MQSVMDLVSDTSKKECYPLVYMYCKVCRLNHSQNSKHRFSQRHQQQLMRILKGYGKRIKESRRYLQTPKILDGEFEPGSHFWCHFCSGQFSKHVSDREISVLYAGVFEHLASKEHWQHTDAFFHENGADKKYKASFIISKLDFDCYIESVHGLLRIREQKSLDDLKNSACHISKIDHIRSEALFDKQEPSSEAPVVCFKTVRNKFGILQNPTGLHDGVRVWGGGIFKYKPGSDQWIAWELDDASHGNYVYSKPDFNCQNSIFTVDANARDLTKIQIPFSSKGNVHTGATPPWHQSEEDENNGGSHISSAPIGPSEELFLKNLERKGKIKKVNPKRVGANFDHSASDREDWLPSFGRVWSDGPRWQSRVAFRLESHSTKKRPRKK